jgi:hypothetical protein
MSAYEVHRILECAATTLSTALGVGEMLIDKMAQELRKMLPGRPSILLQRYLCARERDTLGCCQTLNESQAVM